MWLVAERVRYRRVDQFLDVSRVRPALRAARRRRAPNAGALSLVHYGVIFTERPQERAAFIASRLDHLDRDWLVSEIEDELRNPSQSVRDILDLPARRTCGSFSHWSRGSCAPDNARSGPLSVNSTPAGSFTEETPLASSSWTTAAWRPGALPPRASFAGQPAAAPAMASTRMSR